MWPFSPARCSRQRSTAVIDKIRFQVREGKIVEASAQTGEDALKALAMKGRPDLVALLPAAQMCPSGRRMVRSVPRLLV